MKTFALAASVGLACGSLATFDTFVQANGRLYAHDSAEYKLRQGLYEQRLAQATAHNSQADRMWTAGVNKLWDWTEQELQSLRGWDGSGRPANGGRAAVRKHSFLQQAQYEVEFDELPTEKIWSNISAAQNIRNQGDCGSCWAIAVSTVLEAHAEIYGHPRSFSAQQIVECTPNPRHCGGDGGCQGATAELAMDWVMQNGVAEESAVPYTGQDAECQTSAPDNKPAMMMSQMISGVSATPNQMLSLQSGGAGFGMTGWETLPKNEYEPLMRALVERGPVAVSVAADSWAVYNSGIFNGCGKDNVIDHAVTATGYGEENNVKFWVIQNSWGQDWGEAGHIRLQRHADGQYCGMNNDPQKGIACKGETDPVPVCGMCGVLFDSVVPHFQ